MSPQRVHRRRVAPHRPLLNPPEIMKKLTPAVQRLILAFTTGLFLACAAHVSAQGDGLSSVVSATQ
jgi:hypothetical protein